MSKKKIICKIVRQTSETIFGKRNFFIRKVEFRINIWAYFKYFFLSLENSSSGNRIVGMYKLKY